MLPGESLERIERELIACRACPRLVAWREEVARVKTRRFRDETYWGRPVPGFGDPNARVLVVGLAPGAHGAHRTGRIFTGDSSGDFLFPALHRAGYASQPTSASRDDGLLLRDMYISASARCVPPDNRPLPEELRACHPFLVREWRALERLRVVLCLGAIAHDAALGVLRLGGVVVKRADAKFAHGAIHRFEGHPVIVDSFHVSRQNTNTGRLTAAMFDEVLAVVRELSAAR